MSEWPGYSERQVMMQEAIELIRKLWSGEKVSFDGIYYATRKAKLYTLPDKPIPLYISTLAPNSAEFAGRHGDGLITVGGKKPEDYKKILDSFNAGAREAGKDPSKMPKLIELWAEYTDDTDRAVEFMKKYWAGSFVPALYNQKIYTPEMSEENGKAVGSDTILQQSCISSKPEDHVEHAAKYIDLGFTHLFFHSASPDQRGFIERFGQEVLPMIRESAGS
jgi:coenzyme F420-dependent glucose-6-phosphate dehydrogenase